MTSTAENRVCRSKSRSFRGVKLLTLPWYWLAAAIALSWAGTAYGTEPTIVRVEEDWEVQVGQPETEKTSPQIFTVISPYGNISDLHAIFELNHSTQPSYTAGGMQLQTWDGETVLESRNNTKTEKLATTDEVIKFTVVMEIENGNLKFEIVNGSSTTWGTFGGQGYLKAIVATAPNDLNSYDSTLSTKQSKVGFAAHRVKLLARNEVRQYSESGLVVKNSVPVVVHSHNTDSN